MKNLDFPKINCTTYVQTIVVKWKTEISQDEMALKVVKTLKARYIWLANTYGQQVIKTDHFPIITKNYRMVWQDYRKEFQLFGP